MSTLKLFENNQIRSIWDEERKIWFFSVINVVGMLSGSATPRRYWTDLKRKLAQESGSDQLYEKIVQLKLVAQDGKSRVTDCADTETLLRLIQSIPSPKAEPLKQWLARVGYERIEETEDPELAFDRAMETYLKKGYSKEWINQRLKSIEVRKALTDEWENCGIQKGQEFAILTDEITQAWSGLTTHQYKQLKELKKEGLRDHMSNLELVLNMLAEATTTEISSEKQPMGLEESRIIAQQGGTIAGNTRKEIEEKTGKPLVTAKNAKRLK